MTACTNKVFETMEYGPAAEREVWQARAVDSKARGRACSACYISILAVRQAASG